MNLILKGFESFGEYLLLLRRSFTGLLRFRLYWELWTFESIKIGRDSLFLVTIISLFTGAVTTVQTAYQIVSPFIPKSTIGAIVSTSAILELAPTITSLVLAGRVGSNIASQIGSMRVSEQIDALEVMGINSATYLILPRLFGAIIFFPVLVIYSCFIIHVGGILAGMISGAVNPTQFVIGIRSFYEDFQIIFMLIKAFTFGFIISTVSAYQGYYVRGGALEVGNASTRAVVISSLMILVADYVLAQLLL
ncbi:MAG: ABC transporter permease [Bacteroidia bacterium]|nr:ABC transporter permease [Bacteroidia bacterium]MCX7763878.1 ABC transporter permease [Bacteroidia bacterium]MDW8056799.1 ABC transporter permease [Bacteroidia bacterium]